VRNLASCSTSVIFERPAFENAARYLKSETNPVSRDDGRMSSPGLVKFVPRTRHLWDHFVETRPSQKFHIVNNSAADCSILLKLYTEFDHMTPERPQKFKVKGSKVKVSVTWCIKIWRKCQIYDEKNRHISWTDSLTEYKLCVNYPTA